MSERNKLISIYGSKVFRPSEIQHRLTKKEYMSLLNTIENGKSLDSSIASNVAKAMMDWAIENGATHYAHWFQPMTDITACKHDSFFTPIGFGEATLEFPSSTLVKGEPDASSFPSGGLRATFEARGYTTWDPTSPAFVRDGTLFIPSVFVSYNGEALDRKLPLLRSCDAINREALRFIKFFKGNEDVSRIEVSVGAEQEYFLIDRDHYEQRLDLKMCGRTLIGSKPPKAQQLDDHYMARIRTKVSEFMKQLDEELWKLGIPSKTKHNEVAPSQHELAPVFENANLASDHNQLTMDLMRNIAKKNGLALLLHEKPFIGINGSGKHNNYSLVTNTGVNLLQPRERSDDDSLFLLVLCVFIRSIHLYSDLIRMSACSPSNDMRLGGFEAPPPIVSCFLGETITNQLLQTLSDVSSNKNRHKGNMSIHPSIPDFSIDDSDRNRTSPFAFTGNKFEFRMPGSSQSIAVVNTILNTALADSFSYFADKLASAENVEKEKIAIIEDTLKKHGKIIYNGNNYSKEWEKEAIERGLIKLTNTIDSVDALLKEKNITLFEKMKVFSPEECKSRYEVYIENYIHHIIIEAKTLLHMVHRQILPSIIGFAGSLANSYNTIKKAGIDNDCILSSLEKLSTEISNIKNSADKLSKMVDYEDEFESNKEKAKFIRDSILPQIDELRTHCDICEDIVDKKSWPIPTYTEILYKV